MQIHGAGSSQHPMNLEDGNRLVVPLGDMSIIVASLKACSQTRIFFVLFSPWNVQLLGSYVVSIAMLANGLV